MAAAQVLRVGSDAGGRRLDLFLAESLALSRAQVRRLLERGAVRVDGRAAGAAEKGARLEAGCAVEVAPFERPEHERPRAEPEASLALLASGPGWLALDKPAGVAVHPYRADETGTLLNALVARHPELHGVGEGGLRSGVVHRLDLETSGVVLFATEAPSWQRLRAAFRERRVAKLYRALVRGQPGSGSLELALVTARHRPALVRVLEGAQAESARGARRARQSWRTLESFADAALVEVRPETGFLHQIRVSLAHLGSPVLGDFRYGPPDVAIAAPRHMLHAASVAFEEVRAESPDPPDFAALLARLRSEGS